MNETSMFPMMPGIALAGEDNSAFEQLIGVFGIETIPEVFQYAGWMYSGDGLRGYGTKADTIRKDTTVYLRYTLCYGEASSAEWKSFKWESVDEFGYECIREL